MAAKVEKECCARNKMKVEQTQYFTPLIISPWLRELLVDPISKMPFIEQNENGFRAPCGLVYRYKDGVPDFRVKLTIGAQKWVAAQHAFESWIGQYFANGEADPMFYKREQERDRPIYEVMKLSGRILDVGGQLGHIRKYMELHQEYCSIDPFIGVHVLARGRKNLFANYPLSSPLNLVGGFAEFLPFTDACFDTINMRSCLDHFLNPEIALLEAYRVLKKGGKLIIGITIQGNSFRSKAREVVRPIVSFFFHRYKNHHNWHPSYEGLMALCNSCGFDLEREIWQTDDVLYASFLRRGECVLTSDQQ